MVWVVKVQKNAAGDNVCYKLPGCCGIMHQYGLHRDTAGTEQSLRDWNHAGYISLADIPDSYSGLNVISFNKNQLEAYDIKERYDIVFQSPVKRNKNSDNMFFFIVYTNKGK